MTLLGGADDIERALQAVGELLAAEGTSYTVIVIGGAALNLLGIVDRTTRDVDILAFATRGRGGRARLTVPPHPMPVDLARAVATVARDFGLMPDWLNSAPSLQLKAGLPRGFPSRLTWRRYGALQVGLAERRDLIALKLFAAADDQPDGRHAKDLIALRPTDDELQRSARWVKGQDANADAFPQIVDTVIAYVRSQRVSDNG